MEQGTWTVQGRTVALKHLWPPLSQYNTRSDNNWALPSTKTALGVTNSNIKPLAKALFILLISWSLVPSSLGLELSSVWWGGFTGQSLILHPCPTTQSPQPEEALMERGEREGGREMTATGWVGGKGGGAGELLGQTMVSILSVYEWVSISEGALEGARLCQHWVTLCILMVIAQAWSCKLSNK